MVTICLCLAAIWIARAQNNQLGVGKDFTFPDYYPSSMILKAQGKWTEVLRSFTA